MDVVTTREGVGRLEGDEIVVADLPYGDVAALLEDTGSLAALATAPVRQRLPLAGTQLLPPVRRPAVWGVGLNYQSKAWLTGRAVPEEPILYLAAHSSVSGPDGAVSLPDGCTDQLDYEGEIAVVVARRLYRVVAADVWASIAGITAANDMTARDVMKQTGVPALAKSFPGCTPLGGVLRSTDAIGDRSAIPVRTTVNGTLRQDETSADMLWSIAELISRISWFAALEPGDVLLTGTPAGTGQDRGEFLTIGDVVAVEVDGLPALRTTVVPLEPAAPSPTRRRVPVSAS